jgi:hypothetical protein
MTSNTSSIQCNGVVIFDSLEEDDAHAIVTDVDVLDEIVPFELAEGGAGDGAEDGHLRVHDRGGGPSSSFAAIAQGDAVPTKVVGDGAR